MTHCPNGSPAHRAGLPPGSRPSPARRRRRWPSRPIGFLTLLIAVELIVVAGIQAVVVLVLGSAGSGMVDGTAARVAPSGTAAPIGDLPGWRQTFVDEFDGTGLDDRWGVYDGVPAGDPTSLWEPDQVVVENSTLVLRATRKNGGFVTGGVSNHPVAQQYGKWEVRFRMDAADDIPVAFLLWPQGGSWPPEVDFFEDAGGDRSQASAFVHHRTGDGGRDKEHRSLTADFTQWHTVGVEWLPGALTFTLDGVPWSTVSGETVPAQPMWLALQAQSGGCERRERAVAQLCPIVGTPAESDVEIDWVAVWEPA